ncbi:MAG: glycosyltransferase [Bacteroidota bacterium]
MTHPPNNQIALVHDWLTGMRGGEKVLEVLCEMFPNAPIFTLLHNKGSVSPIIESHRIHTSFIQHLPLKRTKYRSYLPLFPRAIESFDFSDYKLIISTSHAVAKGAIPPKDALHICYCHTPMRYVWDQYEEYFGKGRAGVITRTAMRFLAPRLRAWDVRTSGRVHTFIANSRNVAARIQSCYNRSSEVLHAPVDTSGFRMSIEDDGSFLVVSALVPYKRIDLAIGACRQLGRPLKIVGTGPDEGKLRSMAGSDVRFLGWLNDTDLALAYRHCRAVLFPGVEDFGIVPLEAMASGKPVVAFGRGGALETIIDGTTGVFFGEQTVESLSQAIRRLDQLNLDPHAIRRHAEGFDRALFRTKLQSLIHRLVETYTPRN